MVVSRSISTKPAYILTVCTSCIEHWLALIAACMPTLGPFFRWLRPTAWKHLSFGERRLGGTHGRSDPESYQRVWPKMKPRRQGSGLSSSSEALSTPTSKVGQSWYFEGSGRSRSDTSGSTGPIYSETKSYEPSKKVFIQEYELRDKKASP